MTWRQRVIITSVQLPLARVERGITDSGMFVGYGAEQWPRPLVCRAIVLFLARAGARAA